MKSAVIISGLLRNPEESFDIINKSFVKPLDSDIFIYSWVKEEEDKQLNNNYSNSNYSKENIFKLSNKYFSNNLKKIVLEDYEDQANKLKKELNLKDVKKAPYRFFPQCFKLYKVNELRKEYQKENNIIYDIIIITRTELFYGLPIQKKVIKKAIEGLPCFCAAADYGGLQTTLGVLNNENTNKFCNMYINYKDIYLKDQFSFFCNKKNNITTSSFNSFRCPKLYDNNVMSLNSEYLYGYHVKYINFKKFYRFPYSCGVKLADMNFNEKDINIKSFEYFIDTNINYICSLGELPFQGFNLNQLIKNINNNNTKTRNKFFYWSNIYKSNYNNKKLLQIIKEKYKVSDIIEDYKDIVFNIPLKNNLKINLKIWKIK